MSSNENKLSHGAGRRKLQPDRITLAQIEMECMALWSRWLQGLVRNWSWRVCDHAATPHSTVAGT